jgi:hypothetical protein
MANYHLDRKTGNPGPCRARVGRCPFGTQDEHYPTIKEARGAYEELANAQASSRLLSRAAIAEALAKVPPKEAFKRPHTSPEVACLHASLARELEAMNRAGDMYFKPGGPPHENYGSSVTFRVQPVEQEEAWVAITVNTEEKLITYQAAPDSFPKEFGAHYSLPYRQVSYTGSTPQAIADEIFGIMDDLEDNPIAWDNDQAALVHSYFGYGHAEINTALREGTLPEETKRLLDEALAGEELEEPLTVYRGLRKPSRTVLEQLKSGTYSDPAYLSTSTSASTALNFSGDREGSVLLAITIPKGQRVYQVEGNEQEVLLPRDYKLDTAQYHLLTEKIGPKL